MKVTKYEIIKMWKSDMYILLNKMYPQIPRMEIEGRLDQIIKDKLKKEEMALVDTYREKTLWSDVLDVTQFYFKNKPATAGNGVLFDPTGFNPAIEMLNQFGDRRKAFKKEMKKYDEGTFEFLQNNLYQGNEKVKMNAW